MSTTAATPDSKNLEVPTPKSGPNLATDPDIDGPNDEEVERKIDKYMRGMGLASIANSLDTLGVIASVFLNAPREKAIKMANSFRNLTQSLVESVEASIASTVVGGVQGMLAATQVREKAYLLRHGSGIGERTPATAPAIAIAPAPAPAPAPASVTAIPSSLATTVPVVASPKRPAAASAFRWEAGESERVALKPIRHDAIWEFRKKIEGLHWTAQEVDLTNDRKDWETRMTPDERHFVKMQLAFFSRVDIDVLENLDENFGDEVDCMEARFYYAAQKDQECVHTESYNLQIEAVLDGAERDSVLNAASTMPVIGNMRAWVKRWLPRSLPLADRLVAWAAVEGVLFSASFSALQWLRERNLLSGITEANSFIARDEGVHASFTCLLISTYLISRPTQSRAEAIFRGVISVLDEFVENSLPVRLIGMNADLMKEYVRFQADYVLCDMGLGPMYFVANPFKFMDKLSLNDVAKINFFEKRPSQYQTVTDSVNVQLKIDDTRDEDLDDA